MAGCSRQHPSVRVLAVAAAVVVLSTASGLAQHDELAAGDTTIVERFLQSAPAPLTSYRAVRTLHASARGGSMTAVMRVETTLDPEGGFAYRVLDESGSALIRRRVFLAALAAERDARAPAAAARGALTPANYELRAGEAGADGLVGIDIRPRRQDTLLLAGRIFVTPDDADLVRVQGVLVKRPSFWTRRVEVTRSYARIVGVRVPVSMASVADVLFAGRSTFSMIYDYQSVNGLPAPGPDDLLPAPDTRAQLSPPASPPPTLSSR